MEKNKTMNKKLLTLLFVGLMSFSFAQKTLSPVPCGPVPTQDQLNWHEMENYAFVHFTTNTFTDKEWGFGDESTQVFNPTNLNVDQWVTAIKEAGLKGLVLTCKHHDGFCLWPSKYTEHSIKNSPYKNGQGNIVKEVAEACKRQGIKFGIYLSPWDRNNPDYSTPAYIAYYRNQLKELLSFTGPVFEMWFDGANGGDGYYGGKKEVRRIDASKYYDWPNTIAMVKTLMPHILFFSDAGPNIRWCGNESGYINETNWNTISTDTLYAGKSGISDLLNTGLPNGDKWIPAEVDVSIRPGWFYHAKEDSKVRTPENLFNIYLSSVGRGSNLILNIPPDRRGLINENDLASLRGWKKLLDEAFKTDLAFKSNATADSYRGKSKKYAASNVVDGKKDTYWSTDDNVTTGSLQLGFAKSITVKYVVIQEYIKLGQRVKSFSVEVWKDNKWQQIANGTTIGYKRILKVEPVETDKVRVRITDSKACPVISTISVF